MRLLTNTNILSKWACLVLVFALLAPHGVWATGPTNPNDPVTESPPFSDPKPTISGELPVVNANFGDGGIDCVGLLTEAERSEFIQVEYKNIQKRAPKDHGFILRIFRNSMIEKIKRSCEKSNYCTQSDVKQAVKEATESLLTKSNMVKGTSIIFGVMISASALTEYLHSILPNSPLVKTAGVVIGPIATVFLFQIMSPLMNRISSRTTHWMSSLFDKGGVGSANSVLLREKERQWMITQGTMSPNAQMSRNLVGIVRAMVRGSLLEARDAVRRGDEETAIDMIAEAAINMRWNFEDIQPDNRTVRLTARITFADRIKDPISYFPKVMKRIPELDPEALQSEKVLLYYEYLVLGWLTAGTKSGNKK